MKRFLVVISGIVTSLVAFGQSLAIAPSKPVSAAKLISATRYFVLSSNPPIYIVD